MASPEMQVFPLTGWEYYARMAQPGDPGDLCPAMTYYDDYLDERPGGLHHATDIVANEGTPNIAMVDGYTWPNEQLGDTELEWKFFERGGYHCYVFGDDGYIYYYAHLLDYPLVKPMQRVRVGQILGQTGRSGVVYGCPHTHLAIYKTSSAGNKLGPINPYPYLRQLPVLPLEDSIRITADRLKRLDQDLVLREAPGTGPYMKAEPARILSGRRLGLAAAFAGVLAASGGMVASMLTGVKP